MPNVEPDADHLPARRFFLRPSADGDKLPEILVLDDPFIADHIARVLRLKPGDAILLVVGDAGHIAFIEAIDAQKSGPRVRVRLTRRVDAPLAGPGIHLANGLIKDSHWEWLLQKSTELGVSRITPLLSRHNTIQAKKNPPLDRWERIVTHAAEQSEAWRLPAIDPPATSLDGWLRAPDLADQKLVLLERDLVSGGKQRPLLNDALDPTRAVTLACGPEGGWHTEEIEALLAAGFQPVSLGPKILRSETAAIAALSIITHRQAGTGNARR